MGLVVSFPGNSRGILEVFGLYTAVFKTYVSIVESE